MALGRFKSLCSAEDLEGACRDSFTRRDSVAHLLTKMDILRQKTEKYKSSGRVKASDKAEKMARAVQRKLDAKREAHEAQREATQGGKAGAAGSGEKGEGDYVAIDV